MSFGAPGVTPKPDMDPAAAQVRYFAGLYGRRDWLNVAATATHTQAIFVGASAWVSIQSRAQGASAYRATVEVSLDGATFDTTTLATINADGFYTFQPHAPWIRLAVSHTGGAVDYRLWAGR